MEIVILPQIVIFDIVFIWQISSKIVYFIVFFFNLKFKN